MLRAAMAVVHAGRAQSVLAGARPFLMASTKARRRAGHVDAGSAASFAHMVGGRLHRVKGWGRTARAAAFTGFPLAEPSACNDLASPWLTYFNALSGIFPPSNV